ERGEVRIEERVSDLDSEFAPHVLMPSTTLDTPGCSELAHHRTRVFDCQPTGRVVPRVTACQPVDDSGVGHKVGTQPGGDIVECAQCACAVTAIGAVEQTLDHPGGSRWVSERVDLGVS